MTFPLQKPRAREPRQLAEADRPCEERGEPDHDDDGSEAPGDPQDALAPPIGCRKDRLYLLTLDRPHDLAFSIPVLKAENAAKPRLHKILTPCCAKQRRR